MLDSWAVSRLSDACDKLSMHLLMNSSSFSKEPLPAVTTKNVCVNQMNMHGESNDRVEENQLCHSVSNLTIYNYCMCLRGLLSGVEVCDLIYLGSRKGHVAGICGFSLIWNTVLPTLIYENTQILANALAFGENGLSSNFCPWLDYFWIYIIIIQHFKYTRIPYIIAL